MLTWPELLVVMGFTRRNRASVLALDLLSHTRLSIEYTPRSFITEI
jgi:hypothetical protein